MGKKEAESGVNVFFSGVKRGELVITENEIVLYKRKSLFSPRSIVRKFPLSEVSAVQPGEKNSLKIEGARESGEVVVETLAFENKSGLDKVLKHLQDYLEGKAKKTKAEEEQKEAKKREQERKEKKELYRQFIDGNLSHLWFINRNLFRLCSAIPKAEWDNIKDVSRALQKDVESFLSENAVGKNVKLDNFQELAEKEELTDLEKGAANLLEYLSGLMGKRAPEGTPSPSDDETATRWEDLRYFFLYTALLGEAGLLLELDEPGEVFDIAARLELSSAIMEEKFGFIKDKSLAPSLKLPRKHGEALSIYKKLVAEVDAFIQATVEEQT